MIIKKLSGHSGCEILLCADDSNSQEKYVRKISPDVSYNERLLNQSQKQEKFTSKLSIIESPKILRRGHVNDLFYFDMNYINGKSLSDHIRSSDISTVVPLIKALQDYLSCDKIQQTEDLSKFIQEKIKNIRTKTTGYEKFYEHVLQNNWQHIPTSECHGDLTFENLIVSNGKLHFIDFLDSFIDTKLIDVAKLLFDVRYFWSSRFIKQKPIVKSIYVDEILKNTQIYKDNKKSIDCLIVLNILRVIPYCKDKQTLAHLERSLEHAIR